MNRGYIKLYRKFADNEIFTDSEPFDKRSAWVDLIMTANHKDGFVFRGMTKYVIKRGQRITSLGKLAERWRWGERKVKAYLKMLENEGMIYLEVSNRGLLITIVNYGLYQDFSPKSAEQTAEPTAEQTAERVHTKLQSEPQSRVQTNNNVKNDIKNGIKNEFKNVNKRSAHSDFFVEE